MSTPISSTPTLLSPPSFIPQATTFGKRVVYSGFVHAKVGSPVVVTVQDLTFRFTFNDSGKPTPSFTPKAPNPKTVEFELRDFVSSLGTGIVDPLSLGQLNGVPFYLLFTVYALQGTPVKLLFCTFLQDEVGTATYLPNATAGSANLPPSTYGPTSVPGPK